MVQQDDLMELGAVRSKLDNAMFMWYSETSEIVGNVVSHVDIFIYTGTSMEHSSILD